MKKNNEEVFEFNSDENIEEQNEFNYDSINGLGESNYENEDLFNNEVDYSQDIGNLDDNFSVGSVSDSADSANDDYTYTNYSEDYLEKVVPNLEESDSESKTDKEETEENDKEASKNNVETNTDESIEENNDSAKEVNLSDTPIDELKDLTKYEEEKIESTNINELFDKVSLNVKDASEIFKKNTDLKSKIDSKFEKLKKLQSEIESSKKSQIDEIDKYKEEVLGKLTEKKEEIEKRLNLLKEFQSNLEKEKQEFEQYKKKEQENIDKIQREVQSAYDERREELSHIEDVLRKQKDALDEARNELSLDKIQYEADKNELANNLLKFNDLVNSFTSGVSDTKE